MSEADKRRRDKEELSELYKQIEHARNEQIALRAISIAGYWINKAEKQAIQIQNLERRNERKNGKWTPVDDEGSWATYICSECEYYAESPYNFCPSCGADMREPMTIPEGIINSVIGYDD